MKSYFSRRALTWSIGLSEPFLRSFSGIKYDHVEETPCRIFLFSFLLLNI